MEFLPAPARRPVSLGRQSYDFPSKDLEALEPCNHLMDDVDACRRMLEDKGYLFVKGLHNRDEVLEAREAVLKHIASTGSDKLVGDISSGVLDSRCGRGCVPFMEGANDLTHSEAVLKVLEGQRPRDFFKKLFGEEELTFDYKWLRAMYNEGFTGAHVDNVYMGRGTADVLTMWTPFGDVPVEMGVIAVCEASHRLPEFKHFQETYGSCDIEAENLEGTGWFTLDPKEISQLGGIWKTADYDAGDVIIFNLRTIHMSTLNRTEFARVSCDTRWQPKSKMADHRFVGHEVTSDSKFGVYGETEGNQSSKPMGDTPMGDESMEDKSMEDKSIEDKSMEDKSIEDKSIEDKSRMEDLKRKWGFGVGQ